MYLDFRELEAEPLKVMRQVERHLGLPPHKYAAAALQERYNVQGCYGWTCKGNSTHLQQRTTGVPLAVRERLQQFFAPTLAALPHLVPSVNVSGFSAAPP
jgi:hypothetical protein